MVGAILFCSCNSTTYTVSNPTASVQLQNVSFNRMGLKLLTERPIVYTLDGSTPEGQTKLQHVNTEAGAYNAAIMEAIKLHQCNVLFAPQFEILKNKKRIVSVTVIGTPAVYENTEYVPSTNAITNQTPPYIPSASPTPQVNVSVSPQQQNWLKWTAVGSAVVAPVLIGLAFKVAQTGNGVPLLSTGCVFGAASITTGIWYGSLKHKVRRNIYSTSIYERDYTFRNGTRLSASTDLLSDSRTNQTAIGLGFHYNF